MEKSKLTRYENTFHDLVKLNVQTYCDLGSGGGEIAIKLKEADKNIICLEAPWEFEERTKWAKEKGIKVYKGEFFESDFEKIILDKVDCFSLIHAIAHLRFPPHILFEKIYNKLEKGGYFYLSTVNASAFNTVLKHFRGQAITEEVVKNANMSEEYYKYCNPTGRHLIWDNWMHVKEYTISELKKIFEDEKFKVVEMKHRNNFSHWKLNLACKFFPHLSEEIIIIGQKI